MNLDARSVVLAVLAAVLALHEFQRWEMRPLHPAAGILAVDDPLQTPVAGVTLPSRGRWQLQARAGYDVTARVLSLESYHIDTLADLVPEDLALGWGVMSDSSTLQSVAVDQGGRFYFWRIAPGAAVTREQVIQHSANTHVIPANPEVWERLKRLRVGQVVHLTGYLVDATRDDGAWLHTSLTRSDTGPGSCEVLFVETAQLR